MVGIYSGADKLGEGFGSSLKMAEYRVRTDTREGVLYKLTDAAFIKAAEDALLRLYLTETPPDEISLPTTTLHSSKDVTYAAPILGEQEAMYKSAGRSSIVLGNRRDDIDT